MKQSLLLQSRKNLYMSMYRQKDTVNHSEHPYVCLCICILLPCAVCTLCSQKEPGETYLTKNKPVTNSSNNMCVCVFELDKQSHPSKRFSINRTLSHFYLFVPSFCYSPPLNNSVKLIFR